MNYVFLHGTPGDGSVWSAVMALCPAGVTCALLELPDHGRAPDERLGSAAALEERVAARIAELGDELVLVGHSYGAYVCARLAPRLGARVARMVLVSGLPGLPAERSQAFVQLALQLQRGELSSAELASSVAQTWYGPDASVDQQWQVADLFERTGPVRLQRLLARLAQLEQPALQVAPYAAPTLLLHAERDAAVPLALGRELCGLGRRARLEVLDSASHMLPLTHPAHVVRAVFAT